LEKYHWPGNVRELRHAIERAVILTESNSLQPLDFPFPDTEQPGDSFQFDKLDLEMAEKTIIRKALAKHSGNISHAAEELGITRAALYRRMEKHGL
jgi:two-component system response regulator HydG